MQKFCKKLNFYTGRCRVGEPRRAPHRAGVPGAVGVQRQDGDTAGGRAGGVQKARVPATRNPELISDHSTLQ